MFNWLKDKAFRDLEHEVRQLVGRIDILENRQEMFQQRINSLQGAINRAKNKMSDDDDDDALKELERLKAWVSGGVGGEKFNSRDAAI